MFERILFVCVGNICRSPMAEAIFKQRIANLNPNIQISSAGLGALVGKGVPDHIKTLLHARNIDISAHRAQQLTEQMVIDADLILTMEAAHKREIEHLFPFSRGKVFLVGKWSHFEVPDPYGGVLSYYDHTLKLIDQGLDDWQKRICKT